MDLKKILPKNGPPIDEVSKYIEKYKNDLIVIKYGGNVFIDRNIFDNFITDINILSKLGISFVVVHGGGPRIKRELDKSNIQSKFIRGLRVTDEKIINIVESVLIDFNNDIDEKTLYSIINQAYQDNKYLIISSLNSIKNIQTKIKDLESRFSSFVDIGIDLPTDELIRVILTKNFSDKQIQVSEKNIEYILKNIERSYEKINTFSNSIDSLSLTKAQPIKLHLIKKVLNEISIQ